MKKINILLCALCLAGTSVYAQEKCQVLVNGISGSYEGDCKKGKADGQGEAKGTDMYKGEFRAGYPDGQGMYLWSNGDNYNGNWIKGKRDGQGTMTIKREGKTDSVITGFWKKDVYAGKYEKPYFVHHRSNHISRVEVKKGKDNANAITFDVSSTSAGIPQFGRGSISPRKEITEILLSAGSYTEMIHVSSTPKGSVKKLINVTFPFRAKVRFGSQEMDLEILEPGTWNTTVAINE
ncbi:MAG TPA: hypothetical protein VGE26_11455 [Sphingobacteriaceae bacterium]